MSLVEDYVHLAVTASNWKNNIHSTPRQRGTVPIILTTIIDVEHVGTLVSRIDESTSKIKDPEGHFSAIADLDFAVVDPLVHPV